MTLLESYTPPDTQNPLEDKVALHPRLQENSSVGVNFRLLRHRLCPQAAAGVNVGVRICTAGVCTAGVYTAGVNVQLVRRRKGNKIQNQGQLLATVLSSIPVILEYNRTSRSEGTTIRRKPHYTGADMGKRS